MIKSIMDFIEGRKKTLLRAAVWTFSVQAVQTAAYIVVFFLMLYLAGDPSYWGVFGFSVPLLALAVAYYFVSVAGTSASLKAGYGIVADIRVRLVDHLRRLPLSYFRRTNNSKISGCFLHDMVDAESIFCVYLQEMTACVAIVVLLGGAMGFVTGFLSLIPLVGVAASVPLLYKAYTSTGTQTQEFLESRALADGTILEYLGGIGELKANGILGRDFTPWATANENFRRLALALEVKVGNLCRSYISLLDITFAATMAVGGWAVSTNRADASVLLFILLISGRFYEPLQNIGVFLAEFRFATESLRRIASIFEEEPLQQMPGYTPPKDLGVAFENVSFAYGQRQVLNDISFHMPQGTVTALVGESGGGKTTTANLLLRFWDVSGGRIRIGGTDVRTFSQSEFYKLFSVVFQDVYLFNDTVLNNIRMARPEASREEVMDAARKAHCHEFIMELEETYDTPVGEGGARLSGGERQRIAIARAILKDAPLLVLDEATASVDPENELLIQQALGALVQGKTLLVIAHRLSTVRGAHQILVLKQGDIVERGTHEELISQKGIYHQFWQSQERMKSWSIQ